MATFVLVHGAFYGGWSWRRVRALLARAGHEVFTPSLTGAGDRAHLLHPLRRDISLATHIQDIVNVLEYEDLHDVVLAGASYGGMVITGAADKVPERVAHLVYVDAHVPSSGQSASGAFSEGTSEVLESMSQAGASSDDTWLLPPLPPQVLGITREEDIAWVTPRAVPHPLHTLNEPLFLTSDKAARIPRTYIYSTDRKSLIDTFGTDPLALFVEKARREGFRFRELPTGHNPMISMPEELTQLLLEAAGSS